MVTSLAVGVVGGQTLIAVGLSDDGILIFNDQLQLVTQIGDIGTGNSGAPDQTPATALAFGPPTGAGQGGILAVGVMSPWEDMFSYRLSPAGHEQSMVHSGGPWLTLAATVAKVNGQLYAVYGANNGSNTIFVMNVDTGNELTHYVYQTTQLGDQSSGLTPLTPWNGDADNQQIVLGTFGGTRDAVLQYVDGALTALPIGTGGAVTGTADQIDDWWPGYAAGRLRVADNSSKAVTVAMASRPDPGYGCWLNTSVTGGAAAFPISDTSVAAGGVSADYFAGALTAGTTGDCASGQPDSKGEHATYVVITPDNDPADEHIVKLAASEDGTLSIAEQTGGYLTAALSRIGTAPGSWGTWQLTVTAGSTATAIAPTVAGARLTSAPDPAYQAPGSPQANDPCFPVYRFDVSGARWDNVVSSGQVAAQIPPMTAQGSTDGGKTWTDLGQLMPSTAPSVDAKTGSVTLGQASFYWQDPPGSSSSPSWAGSTGQCTAKGTAPLTDVRVLSGGVPSNMVNLSELPAPAENGGAGAVPVNGITVLPETANTTASPRANGVDQAPLDVTLVPVTGGGIIAPGDPRYNDVYYRYATTNVLVTGLYTPGAYGDYVAVGPYAAAGGSGPGPVVKNYLVTTDTGTQSLVGVLNDTGDPMGGTSVYTSGPMTVAATSSVLSPGPASATAGITITGCTTPNGLCTLTLSPALYQAGSPDTGPVTGLLLQAWAITGQSSLPLQVGTANAHHLGSAPLKVTQAKAQLLDTSPFFPSDTIDTDLVTSGDLIPAQSIQVGT